MNNDTVKKFDYPLFTLGEILTAEQKAFFEKYGFIHFKSFLNKDAVQQVIRATEDVQAQWINEEREKINGVPIKWGSDVDGKKIVQRFAFSSLFSPVLHEV